MKKQIGVLLLVIAVVLLAGSSAQAVLITNGATTLYDSGGFESDTVRVFPLTGSGTWSPWTYNVQNDGILAVTDAVDPGAYQDSNYVKMVRPVNTGTTSHSSSLFMTLTTQTAGTVHMEFAIRTIGASQIYLQDKDGNNAIMLNFVAASTHEALLVHNAVDGWKSSGLAWSDNVWKTVEVDYTIGATTADITVDKESATVTVYKADTIGKLAVSAGAGGTMYIDSIPEPATMSLLAIGGLGVLIRRRR